MRKAQSNILMILAVCAFTSAAGCNGQEDPEEKDFGDWDGGCKDDPNDDLPSKMTWQWQLVDDIDVTVNAEMYDIDLFDVPKSTIDKLRTDGRTVICYFSAGTWEKWRDDALDFPEEAIGNTLEKWDDEKWLDVRSDAVRDIMLRRLDEAVSKGCDGVEPDNMDGYLNNPGFDFTGYDQLDYNSFIADEAHARGLSVGLKNDVDQLIELEPCFDWALNEECLNYNECDLYKPFLESKKAVFHVEYVDDISQGQDLADRVCKDPSIAGFSTLIKEWDLTAWRIACD